MIKKDKQMNAPLNGNIFMLDSMRSKNQWYIGKVQDKYRNEVVN